MIHSRVARVVLVQNKSSPQKKHISFITIAEDITNSNLKCPP